MRIATKCNWTSSSKLILQGQCPGRHRRFRSAHFRSKSCSRFVQAVKRKMTASRVKSGTPGSETWDVDVGETRDLHLNNYDILGAVFAAS